MIASLDDLILFLRKIHNYSKPAELSHVPREFPPVLAKFYSELSGLIEVRPSAENDFRSPFDNQDQFLSLEQIVIGDEMIVFATENQGSWDCACSRDHSDTKAYYDIEEIGGESGFNPGGELSEFVISLALQECTHSLPNQVQLTNMALLDAAKSSLPALWLDGEFLADEFRLSFFYDSETAILAMDNGLLGSVSSSETEIYRWLNGLPLPDQPNESNQYFGTSVNEQLILTNKYTNLEGAIDRQDLDSMIEILASTNLGVECAEIRAKEILNDPASFGC